MYIEKIKEKMRKTRTRLKSTTRTIPKNITKTIGKLLLKFSFLIKRLSMLEFRFPSIRSFLHFSLLFPLIFSYLPNNNISFIQINKQTHKHTHTHFSTNIP